jgi:hypothetical protein
MAEDVDVFVVGQDSEAAVTYAVPLVKDFLHFQGARLGLALESEPERPLVGLKAGVTLDFEEQAH